MEISATRKAPRASIAGLCGAFEYSIVQEQGEQRTRSVSELDCYSTAYNSSCLHQFSDTQRLWPFYATLFKAALIRTAFRQT
ncbi:MAG TPA: hypothetical protein VM821_07515 [Abditibacteriaceae bacterium]|nr:hypothetical protein [Abditibacteriaceae bacterium]